MLISIVIPTFEEENLHQTLEHLLNQTVFTKYPNQVEIIIADYDPENKNLCFDGFGKTVVKHTELRYLFVKIFKVQRKGIAYARHEGITWAKGNVIVNFDADARFSSSNAIEKLVEPILENKGVVLTCCDNVLDNNEFDDSKEDLLARITGTGIYELLNNIQKDAPIVCLEPGMCFLKYAYEYSEGFNDVKQAEAILLSPRIIYNFGPYSKKYIPDASVIVSPRRISAMTKFGLLNAINYDNAFRGKESSHKVV